MKRIFFPFLIFVFLFFISCSSKIKNIEYNPDSTEYTCTYKNTKRKFIVCQPDFSNNNSSLILMLHGYGSNAKSFEEDINFSEDALKRGYTVVFVSAANAGWNYSNDKNGKIEEDFLVDLAHYLQKKNNLNPKKLFGIGYSNGAFMCNKLAVSKTKDFTAVVSVAGMMPKNVWEKKKNISKIGYLQINGTKDDVVPMKLNGSNKFNPNPSVEEVIDYFAVSNCVQNQFKTEKLSPDTTATYYGNKVGWILTENTYHSWPTFEFNHYDVNKTILDFLDSQNK